MKETSPDSPYTDRLRSWAQSKVHGGNRGSARRPGSDNQQNLVLPISNSQKTNSPESYSATNSRGGNNGTNVLASTSHDALDGDQGKPGRRGSGGSNSHQNAGSHNGPEGGSLSTPSPQASRKGSQLGTDGTSETTIEKTDQDEPVPNRFKRFFNTGKQVICHSYLNLLLVFVPVGIAVELVPNMPPGVVFGMNAIAIIPLAGLLAFATESVAHNMGDAIGALMNITFGNAVELIILYVHCKYRPTSVLPGGFLGQGRRSPRSDQGYFIVPGLCCTTSAQLQIAKTAADEMIACMSALQNDQDKKKREAQSGTIESIASHISDP